MFDLEKLVIDHLRSFNERLPKARRVADSLEAVVIGPDATFDSLDAVEFLMELEDAIAVAVGRRVDICRRVEQIGREVVTAAEVTACIERLLAPTLLV